MCGLVGIFTKTSIVEIEKNINKSLEFLNHRGPDDSGKEIFSIDQKSIGFGHTRLSIIDLTQAGHQPMLSSDGRYILIFNGEIYNYKELREELRSLGYSFRTNSDTEVLMTSWIHWEVDCLRKLNGMFAFAIYDKKKSKLSLARDGFGIKPMYFGVNDESFFFGSELPALFTFLEKKPELNYQCAYNYLTWGYYDKSFETFYDGINQLRPGHYISIDLKKFVFNKSSLNPVRWWWPSIQERTDLSFDQAADKLREIFLKNVRLHLRSDVPVGVAVSGGVDSSAIICAMRMLEKDMPIHSFSFLAEGEISEEKWIDIINNHVGAIPHKVIIKPEDLGRDIDDMIKTQAEPISSTGCYAQYRVFQAAKEAGIIVTLDGQGADELLAGYDGYPNRYLQSLIERREFFSIMPFLNEWSKWPNRGYKRALQAFGRSLTPPGFVTLARRIFGQNPSPKWLDRNFLEKYGAKIGYPVSYVDSEEGKGRRLVEHLRAALMGDGLAQLLRHGDRNSMKWSVESRVPFLTLEMAEFLLTLPESYLLSPKGETKSIFRHSMRGIVPDAILDRRDKIGFSTPESKWLTQNSNAVNSWLSSANELPFLNEKECENEVTGMLTGRKRLDAKAWWLINYCRWAQL